MDYYVLLGSGILYLGDHPLLPGSSDVQDCGNDSIDLNWYTGIYSTYTFQSYIHLSYIYNIQYIMWCKDCLTVCEYFVFAHRHSCHTHVHTILSSSRKTLVYQRNNPWRNNQKMGHILLDAEFGHPFVIHFALDPSRIASAWCDVGVVASVQTIRPSWLNCHGKARNDRGPWRAKSLLLNLLSEKTCFPFSEYTI